MPRTISHEFTGTKKEPSQQRIRIPYGDGPLCFMLYALFFFAILTLDERNNRLFYSAKASAITLPA